MDDIKLNSKDVHNENPAERFNYHGVLNDTSNKFKGANYGYPSCVAAWDTGLLGVSSLSVGGLFSPDGVPKASDCASRQGPRLSFPSHTAPLDVKFTADGTAAYITFHGSWYVSGISPLISHLPCPPVPHSSLQWRQLHTVSRGRC